MSRHRRAAARVLAVAALTGTYLVAMGLEPSIRQKDSARDMLLARDGIAFGTWDGTEAAFGHFRQGVLWIRFLALTFAAGLGPFGQQVILASLLTASVCLFDRGALTHFGEDLGWEPTAIFLALLLFGISYPTFWNPIMAPLGVTCVTLGLLQVVTRGSTGAACASTAGLALAAEGHPAALLVAPVVVAAVCMSCQRPVRALLLSTISGVVPSFAVSSTTWFHDGRAMLEQPWYVPLIAAGLAGALLLAAALRGRWLALPVERRRWWLLVMIVVGVFAQGAAASVLSRTVLFPPHYYLTVLPALAILTGLGLRRIRARPAGGRWASATVTAIAAVVFLSPMSIALAWRLGVSTGTVGIPDYSIREGKLLASYFWEAGYSFPDVQRHLRGPDSLALISSLAVFAPGPNGSPDRPMADLRILTFADPYQPEGGLPADGHEVPLGRGRRAWILPLDGWVRLAPARVCFAALVGDHAPECADVTTSSIGYHGRYHDLANPSLPGVTDARQRLHDALQSYAMKMTWELPVEINGDDAERYFDVPGVIAPPWVIEAVEGIAHRGELPSRHVVLERTGASSGHLVLGSPVAPWQAGGMQDYPPDFIETPAGEARLRRSIAQLPPLGRRLCTLLGTCP